MQGFDSVTAARFEQQKQQERTQLADWQQEVSQVIESVNRSQLQQHYLYINLACKIESLVNTFVNEQTDNSLEWKEWTQANDRWKGYLARILRILDFQVPSFMTAERPAPRLIVQQLQRAHAKQETFISDLIAKKTTHYEQEWDLDLPMPRDKSFVLLQTQLPIIQHRIQEEASFICNAPSNTAVIQPEALQSAQAEYANDTTQPEKKQVVITESQNLLTSISGLLSDDCFRKLQEQMSEDNKDSYVCETSSWTCAVRVHLQQALSLTRLQKLTKMTREWLNIEEIRLYALLAQAQFKTNDTSLQSQITTSLERSAELRRTLQEQHLVSDDVFRLAHSQWHKLVFGMLRAQTLKLLAYSKGTAIYDERKADLILRLDLLDGYWKEEQALQPNTCLSQLYTFLAKVRNCVMNGNDCVFPIEDFTSSHKDCVFERVIEEQKQLRQELATIKANASTLRAQYEKSCDNETDAAKRKACLMQELTLLNTEVNATILMEDMQNMIPQDFVQEYANANKDILGTSKYVLLNRVSTLLKPFEKQARLQLSRAQQDATDAFGTAVEDSSLLALAFATKINDIFTFLGNQNTALTTTNIQTAKTELEETAVNIEQLQQTKISVLKTTKNLPQSALVQSIDLHLNMQHSLARVAAKALEPNSELARLATTIENAPWHTTTPTLPAVEVVTTTAPVILPPPPAVVTTAAAVWSNKTQSATFCLERIEPKGLKAVTALRDQCKKDNCQSEASCTVLLDTYKATVPSVKTARTQQLLRMKFGELVTMHTNLIRIEQELDVLRAKDTGILTDVEIQRAINLTKESEAQYAQLQKAENEYEDLAMYFLNIPPWMRDETEEDADCPSSMFPMSLEHVFQQQDDYVKKCINQCKIITDDDGKKQQCMNDLKADYEKHLNVFTNQLSQTSKDFLQKEHPLLISKLHSKAQEINANVQDQLSATSTQFYDDLRKKYDILQQEYNDILATLISGRSQFDADALSAAAFVLRPPKDTLCNRDFWDSRYLFDSTSFVQCQMLGDCNRDPQCTEYKNLLQEYHQKASKITTLTSSNLRQLQQSIDETNNALRVNAADRDKLETNMKKNQSSLVLVGGYEKQMEARKEMHDYMQKHETLMQEYDRLVAKRDLEQAMFQYEVLEFQLGQIPNADIEETKEQACAAIADEKKKESCKRILVCSALPQHFQADCKKRQCKAGQDNCIDLLILHSIYQRDLPTEMKNDQELQTLKNDFLQKARNFETDKQRKSLLAMQTAFGKYMSFYKRLYNQRTHWSEVQVPNQKAIQNVLKSIQLIVSGLDVNAATQAKLQCQQAEHPTWNVTSSFTCPPNAIITPNTTGNQKKFDEVQPLFTIVQTQSSKVQNSKRLVVDTFNKIEAKLNAILAANVIGTEDRTAIEQWVVELRAQLAVLNIDKNQLVQQSLPALEKAQVIFNQTQKGVQVRAEKQASRAEAERAQKEMEQKEEQEAKLEAERERLETERLERERLAAEQAEAARIAAEQAEAARIAAEKAEAARIAAEKAEAARITAEQAEAARIAAEQAEAARIAAEKAEAARIAAEQVEAARIAAEQAEAARIAAENAEAARIAAENEAARIAAERAEATRITEEQTLQQATQIAAQSRARLAQLKAQAQARAAEQQQQAAQAAAESKRLEAELKAEQDAERLAQQQAAAQQLAQQRAAQQLAQQQLAAQQLAAQQKNEAERKAAMMAPDCNIQTDFLIPTQGSEFLMRINEQLVRLCETQTSCPSKQFNPVYHKNLFKSGMSNKDKISLLYTRLVSSYRNLRAEINKQKNDLLQYVAKLDSSVMGLSADFRIVETPSPPFLFAAQSNLRGFFAKCEDELDKIEETKKVFKPFATIINDIDDLIRGVNSLMDHLRFVQRYRFARYVIVLAKTSANFPTVSTQLIKDVEKFLTDCSFATVAKRIEVLLTTKCLFLPSNDAFLASAALTEDCQRSVMETIAFQGQDLLFNTMAQDVRQFVFVQSPPDLGQLAPHSERWQKAQLMELVYDLVISNAKTAPSAVSLQQLRNVLTLLELEKRIITRQAKSGCQTKDFVSLQDTVSKLREKCKIQCSSNDILTALLTTKFEALRKKCIAGS